MIEWVKQNSELLMVVANFGTLVIWAFYAQLLYNGYRRVRRPRLIINKGLATSDLDAPCLICNMSQEPVFVLAILVDLETSEGTFAVSATDSEEGEDDKEKAALGRRTRQGPLDSGSCLEVPTFRTLLEKGAEAGELVLGKNDLPDNPEVRLHRLVVTLVAIYGSEDEPFGASRSFKLDCSKPGQVQLKAETLDTARLTSKHQKYRLKKRLEDYL